MPKEEIPVISSIAEFYKWILDLEGGRWIYRGLANKAWPVCSSASRRIKEGEEDIPPSIHTEYIEERIDHARQEGHGIKDGKELSDLELLAELQHYSAATGLIDFSYDPLVALWFACQIDPEHPEQNGKVVAVDASRVGGGGQEFAQVIYKDLKRKVRYFFTGEKIWEWTPPKSQNNRIVAQKAVFLFGPVTIGNDKEVEIGSSLKKEIIKHLQEKHGITEEYLFPDFPGFAMANSWNKPYTGRSADSYCTFGDNLFQRRQYDKAIEYYTKAIKIDPDYALAYHHRGLVKAMLNLHKEALEDYDKVIDLDSNNAPAYNNRGNLKLGLGLQQEALEDYEEAIKIDQNYAPTYNNRGNLKLRLGLHQEALEDYGKVIDLDSNNAAAYNNRGGLKLKQKQYQEAWEDCDTAIKIDRNYANAYINRGIANAGLNLHKEALEDFNTGIRINLQNAEAHKLRLQDAEVYKLRAIVKQQLGDESGAQEDLAMYEKLKDKDKDKDGDKDEDDKAD